MISRLKRTFMVRLFLSVKMTTEMPHTKMARVDSMKGAPRMAPMPISSPALPPEMRIAMSGMMVSGSAVPTAASTLPTAPSPRLQLAAEPLDAVDEQLAPGEDHGEGDYEKEDRHGRRILPQAYAQERPRAIRSDATTALMPANSHRRRRANAMPSAITRANGVARRTSRPSSKNPPGCERRQLGRDVPDGGDARNGHTRPGDGEDRRPRAAAPRLPADPRSAPGRWRC